jgi:hypothetical protein
MDHPQELHRVDDGGIAIGMTPEATPTGRASRHENESLSTPPGQRGQQLPALRVRTALDHFLYQNDVEELALNDRQKEICRHVARARLANPATPHPKIHTHDLRASSVEVARSETGSASQIRDSQPVERRHPTSHEREHSTPSGHNIGLQIGARFLASDTTPVGP